ncbi:MAG: hypothetical protein CMP12_06885 [Zunongwangia sp.]|uniref:Response regulatory domain-containing protein n=1 Tax=Zunongwangia profunda TaxID=398743 RepID=A0A3D5IZS5_9FLAO|nr:response regulator [Zunongwangia profunda]MAC63426.1 hypothetical protein [Flavobacteriaceae bacterium]MAO35628.1 hypothetical protein [Zunongwangia sp.]MAS69604.1 hypothetical protein [Zunongwangia sp.]HCV80898.1 hypothetical protein [Zunongwangia profunda]|tara:strand:+ start:3177 stop:3569 length:393 start_codon:yes stop_codon:yes gene_type:complete
MKFQKSIRILAVDDNLVNQFLIRSIILKLYPKAEIITADTGEESIEIFRKSSNFDLILMDLQLPGISGYEASKKIKKLVQGKPTPIVALSASKMEDMISKGKPAGIDDFLSKPILPETTRKILIKYIFDK